MAMRRYRSKLLFVLATFITVYVLYKTFTSKSDVTYHKQIAREDSDEKLKPADKKIHLQAPQPAPVKEGAMYQEALAMNFEQKMHNVEQFGPHTADSIILVVQIHDRVNFFREFLKSLQSVRDVDKATLVISMDKFLPEWDEVISGINFCRHMTIFFPFSMQLFPNSFPGEDPNDCPRDISKQDALAKQCNNAECPDMYGHYREVKYVQIKHHWFWKLHMVFQGIREFSAQKAPVILLEEDYFLFPDILHCAVKALELKEAKCQRCSTISLGNYEPAQDNSQSNAVEIRAWSSTKSNMGMVITRDFYDKIVACTDEVCNYDDYNWDWSLQAVSAKCIPGGLFTVQFKFSRIVHLGSCGGVHSQSNCNLEQELAKAREKIQSNNSLFPESLHVASDNPAVVASPRPNGGWGDLRDQTLCKRYKSLCEAAMTKKSTGL